MVLLQIDQSCVDRGSWVLSSELSLENPPPFHNLMHHAPPDVAQGDLPFSRILDPRWAEVTLAGLKDREDYINRRRSLDDLKEQQPVLWRRKRRSPAEGSSQKRSPKLRRTNECQEIACKGGKGTTGLSL